jgi:hypothetical protein
MRFARRASRCSSMPRWSRSSPRQGTAAPTTRRAPAPQAVHTGGLQRPLFPPQCQEMPGEALRASFCGDARAQHLNFMPRESAYGCATEYRREWGWQDSGFPLAVVAEYFRLGRECWSDRWFVVIDLAFLTCWGAQACCILACEGKLRFIRLEHTKTTKRSLQCFPRSYSLPPFLCFLHIHATLLLTTPSQSPFSVPLSR